MKKKSHEQSEDTHVRQYLHSSGRLIVALCLSFELKTTQPCVTFNVPTCTDTHSEVPRVPSMCPLFCSGAGMCGTGWHCHTGQLTASTGCWCNWTQPQRGEFPPTLCPCALPCGNNGTVTMRFTLAHYKNWDPLQSCFKYFAERRAIFKCKLLSNYFTPLTFTDSQIFTISI